MIFANRLIGQNDYNKVISSDWTLVDSVDNPRAVSIVYGDDRTYGECFFCCTSTGNRYTSTDGITWRLRDSVYILGAIYYAKVFFANSSFITFYSATNEKVYYELTYPINGKYEFILDDSANMSVDGLVYFNNKYYIAGIQNGQGFIRYSEDLIDWSDSIPIITTAIHSMTASDSCIVISTANGLFSSNDGIYWTQTLQLPTSFAYSYPKVIFAKNRFIAPITLNSNLRFFVSYDGYSWTRAGSIFLNVGGTFTTICYGLEKVIFGVTANPTQGSGLTYAAGFAESMDLSTWQTKKIGTMNGINDIAYGNGRFVAVNGNTPSTNACAYKLWGIE